ncbi:MAG TPA: TolC family protein, partial [Candidatus Eisenbacteria bacterium]
MTRTQRATAAVLGVAGLLWAAAAPAEPLTADRAVQIALQKNSQMISALASELEAKGGLYSAYSFVLPHLSANAARAGSQTQRQSGAQLFGSVVVPVPPSDNTAYSTTPQITGTWAVLDFSSLKAVSAAGAGLKASRLSLQAARSDVALATRTQFYNTVGAYRLARVAIVALRLARDNERRVRALFEVGSVSRSDLLSAQVQTANSQLDSLTAEQAVVNQRIALAEALALKEAEMGDIDTVLTAEPRDYDEASVLAEAEKSRPDLQAATASLSAARLGVTAAKFGRLPYLTVSGAAQFSPRSTFTQTDLATGIKTSGISEEDRLLRGTIALNWDFFDGLATDARVATANAQLLRAKDNHDALYRNLAAEVHQALISYNEAVERLVVANSAFA